MSVDFVGFTNGYIAQSYWIMENIEKDFHCDKLPRLYAISDQLPAREYETLSKWW